MVRKDGAKGASEAVAIRTGEGDHMVWLFH